MALITCPECGKTISDKASACIGCGCPVSKMNLENAQTVTRSNRRRRYRAEQPERNEDTAAASTFDGAAFQAALQEYFPGDAPVRLLTSAHPAQDSEAAQKAEAYQRLAQVVSMASAQQAAPAKPEQQAQVSTAQAVPVNPAPVKQTVSPRPAVSSPAPVKAAAASTSVSGTTAAGTFVSGNKPTPEAPVAPGSVPVQAGQTKKPANTSQTAAPTPAQPTTTVPSEMPEYGFFFGVMMSLLRQGIGVLSYAAMAALAVLVVRFLQNGTVGDFLSPEIVLGLLGGYLIAALVVNLDFFRAKRFLRKGGYLDAIRNDGPEMTNCINAYHLHPSRAMLWYIKRLNPAHGAKLTQWAKEAKQEKRKRRLRYLPYALLLAVLFYLLPHYDRLYDLLPLSFTVLQLLLIEHLLTLLVVILYSRKNHQDTEPLVIELLIVFAGIFALMLYVHDFGELWYHIIIHAVVVYIAIIIGSIMGEKRKK